MFDAIACQPFGRCPSPLAAFQPTTLVAAAWLACAAAAPAHAQSATPDVDRLAAQLAAQQAQLQVQSELLEQQRQVLERQQQQIESLAAALEAQRGPAPVAAAAPAAPAASAGGWGTTPAAGAVAAAPVAPTPTNHGLQWEGYADFALQRLGVYENAQTLQARQRGRADLARFVLAPSWQFGNGWSFAGEIEFEHGGTGATVEFEAEEAGEFETEVEKGGEIVLEQLYLQYAHSPELVVRVGELVLPVGMINRYHQPTEYFTVERSLAESALIPAVWHEMGVEVGGSWGPLRYQVQLVTALDSTGFSGYGFVSGGTQRRLEYRNANAFALVAAAEWSLLPGAVVGGAYYIGDSRDNRARDNLAVPARVVLAEVHGRYQSGPWTLRGQWLHGTVQNSAWIVQANLNTFNGNVLGASRTPVGSRAQAVFVEGGYDVLALMPGTVPGRLDAFARWERFDTHAGTAPTIAANPRYRRSAWTVGLNYKPQPGIVLKAELGRRLNDADQANSQNVAGVAAGFEF